MSDALAEMTAAEFNGWRKHLGLSHASAAQALGVCVRQIAYYAKGEKIVPKYIALACEGLEARHAMNDVRRARELLGLVLETAAKVA